MQHSNSNERMRTTRGKFEEFIKGLIDIFLLKLNVKFRKIKKPKDTAQYIYG